MDKERRKQIEKRIEGLERQREKHKEKIENLDGRKDTTCNYWEKEIRRMDDEIEELKDKLEEDN